MIEINFCQLRGVSGFSKFKVMVNKCTNASEQKINLLSKFLFFNCLKDRRHVMSLARRSAINKNN